MTRNTEGRQFQQDVFPVELDEIRRRRREAGDDRVLSEDAAQVGPHVNHDLIGLAFSLSRQNSFGFDADAGSLAGEFVKSNRDKFG
jgi:hypothetical protein